MRIYLIHIDIHFILSYCIYIALIVIPMNQHSIIELDYGKIYRKALYLMVKTMVSCKFSLKPIQ